MTSIDTRPRIYEYDEPLDPNFGKIHPTTTQATAPEHIPAEEEFQDMFSKERDIIQERILRDRRYTGLVDADVIVKINRAVHKFKPGRFERYLNTDITRDEYIMLALYYNTFYHDKRIHKLAIKKEFRGYDDIMYFTNWVYSIYETNAELDGIIDSR
jgi:hypothetical protein